VKAHHHFSDPEWDGEPIEPEPKPSGPVSPPIDPPKPPVTGPEPRPRLQKIKVELADVQHMMVTSFWHPDGTPMSALQFLEMLFGKLPEFFKDEAELRAL
jgi:type I restriction enzyme R subunit